MSLFSRSCSAVWADPEPAAIRLPGTNTPHSLPQPPAPLGTRAQGAPIPMAPAAGHHPGSRRGWEQPEGAAPAPRPRRGSPRSPAPPRGQSTGSRGAAVRGGNARANLLLLQVDGVRPPLYPEDVGHRVLACAEKQRKGELGTAIPGEHAPRATTNVREAQELSRAWSPHQPVQAERGFLKPSLYQSPLGCCTSPSCAHIPPHPQNNSITSVTVSPAVFESSLWGTVMCSSICEPRGRIHFLSYNHRSVSPWLCLSATVGLRTPVRNAGRATRSCGLCLRRFPSSTFYPAVIHPHFYFRLSRQLHRKPKL